jgi:hypothetical protein
MFVPEFTSPPLVHYTVPESSGVVRAIPLTAGKVALVDDLDYPVLARYKWRAIRVSGGRWYARARIAGSDRYMHRLLAGAEEIFDPVAGMWRAAGKTDHRNGDGLDNRRENLRNCSDSENTMNSVGRPRTRKSKYKGVTPGTGATAGKWRAVIQDSGRQRHLGYFATEEDAAEAYCNAATEIQGAFRYGACVR